MLEWDWQKSHFIYEDPNSSLALQDIIFSHIVQPILLFKVGQWWGSIIEDNGKKKIVSLSHEIIYCFM